LKARSKLYEKILDLWNEEENNLFNNLIINEASTRRSNKILKNLQFSREISLIPSRFKMEKISNKIKEIIFQYLNELRTYKSSLKLRNSHLPSSWLQVHLQDIQKSRPVCPNLLSCFTKELLQDMIEKLTVKRRSTLWVTRQ
jgi:hypothetical protein